MFQLSQESSVIYQEAVPLSGRHEGLHDLPRRRFYRYVRTKTTTTSSSSAACSRRLATPLGAHNKLVPDEDTPARKLMALRGYSGQYTSTDYYLHVSTR